ncbi:MAG: uroporphyrinogen-III synthase [Flavisolibacter sp.]|nr:uroporphyrinogen-III synthase [Flavisolibacter sp.]
MAKYKVLSTKKLEPSLVKQAGESDIELVEQEFISIQPIVSKEKQEEISHWLMNSNADVAFTSANAVEAVKNYLDKNSSRHFYCISGRTRSSLLLHVRDEQIMATADYGKDLAGKIIKQQPKEIIFFCGNKRRDELPGILKEAGIKVNEVTVYETVETPVVAEDDMDAILFFSPSAVQSFFSVNQLKQNVVCFAVGTTTAESISHFTKNKILICEQPSQEMMLNAVKIYFQNTNQYL